MRAAFSAFPCKGCDCSDAQDAPQTIAPTSSPIPSCLCMMTPLRRRGKFLPVCDRLGVQPGQNLGVKLSLHAHLARALEDHRSWPASARRQAQAMTKKHRVYQPRIAGGQIMTPADLKRLHKELLEFERI